MEEVDLDLLGSVKSAEVVNTPQPEEPKKSVLANSNEKVPRKCYRKGDIICYVKNENINVVKDGNDKMKTSTQSLDSKTYSSSETTDNIMSGESLYKTFIFEESQNDNDTEKCIAFWKSVMEKNLKPIKCAIIENKKKKEKEDAVIETDAKSVPSEELEEKIKEATDKVHAEYKALWMAALKEIADKKLDKVKLVGQARCKMCETIENPMEEYSTEVDSAVVKEEIRALNSWESVSKRPKRGERKAYPNDAVKRLKQKEEEQVQYKFVNIIEEKNKKGIYKLWRSNLVQPKCNCNKKNCECNINPAIICMRTPLATRMTGQKAAPPPPPVDKQKVEELIQERISKMKEMDKALLAKAKLEPEDKPPVKEKPKFEEKPSLKIEEKPSVPVKMEEKPSIKEPPKIEEKPSIPVKPEEPPAVEPPPIIEEKPPVIEEIPVKPEPVVEEVPKQPSTTSKTSKTSKTPSISSATIDKKKGHKKTPVEEPKPPTEEKKSVTEKPEKTKPASKKSSVDKISVGKSSKRSSRDKISVGKVSVDKSVKPMVEKASVSKPVEPPIVEKLSEPEKPESRKPSVDKVEETSQKLLEGAIPVTVPKTKSQETVLMDTESLKAILDNLGRAFAKHRQTGTSMESTCEYLGLEHSHVSTLSDNASIILVRKAVPFIREITEAVMREFSNISALESQVDIDNARTNITDMIRKTAKTYMESLSESLVEVLSDILIEQIQQQGEKDEDASSARVKSRPESVEKVHEYPSPVSGSKKSPTPSLVSEKVIETHEVDAFDASTQSASPPPPPPPPPAPTKREECDEAMEEKVVERNVSLLLPTGEIEDLKITKKELMADDLTWEKPTVAPPKVPIAARKGSVEIFKHKLAHHDDDENSTVAEINVITQDESEEDEEVDEEDNKEDKEEDVNEDAATPIETVEDVVVEFDSDIDTDSVLDAPVVVDKITPPIIAKVPVKLMKHKIPRDSIFVYKDRKSKKAGKERTSQHRKKVFDTERNTLDSVIDDKVEEQTVQLDFEMQANDSYFLHKKHLQYKHSKDEDEVVDDSVENRKVRLVPEVAPKKRMPVGLSRDSIYVYKRRASKKKIRPYPDELSVTEYDAIRVDPTPITLGETPTPTKGTKPKKKKTFTASRDSIFIYKTQLAKKKSQQQEDPLDKYKMRLSMRLDMMQDHSCFSLDEEEQKLRGEHKAKVRINPDDHTAFYDRADVTEKPVTPSKLSRNSIFVTKERLARRKTQSQSNEDEESEGSVEHHRLVHLVPEKEYARGNSQEVLSTIELEDDDTHLSKTITRSGISLKRLIVNMILAYLDLVH